MKDLISTLKYEISYWNSLFDIKIQTELPRQVTHTTNPSSAAPFNFLSLFRPSQNTDPEELLPHFNIILHWFSNYLFVGGIE